MRKYLCDLDNITFLLVRMWPTFAVADHKVLLEYNCIDSLQCGKNLKDNTGKFWLHQTSRLLN